MYQQSITHLHRSAIIIAIDCSVSMQSWTYLHKTRMRKMEAASLVANFAIDELLVRASRANAVRNYYDIAVVGYSGDGVEMIIGNENDDLTDIKSLAERTPQPKCYNIIQQDTDGNMVSTPLTLHEWVEPKACGSSPMYEALIQVKKLIADWCDNPHHRDCFPPLVINISDGGCSDAEYDELIDIAKDIKELRTTDGSIIFINIYLSTDRDHESHSIIFPSTEEVIEDENESLLYNMSSVLPKELEHVIFEFRGGDGHKSYKCFARNATICEAFALADIGTEGCIGIKYR